MNRHGIKTETKQLFFMTFKGGRDSSLDQVTLPPSEDQLQPGHFFHTFGEWLRREGHDWRRLPEPEICRLSVEFFNKDLRPGEHARQYHRMATDEDMPK